MAAPTSRSERFGSPSIVAFTSTTQSYLDPHSSQTLASTLARERVHENGFATGRALLFVIYLEVVMKGAPVVQKTIISSLTDQAYERLEELIVTLELAPGSLLSEPDLSARLQIGRTPIREALQRLAREKLVVILPRRGMFVSDINVQNQLKLLELRREIERLLARLAARRASPQQRRALDRVATAMEDAAASNDDRAFMRADLKLNELITTSAQNVFAMQSMSLWHGLSRRFWYQHYRTVADLPLAAELHAKLARAVSGRDEETAAAACDRLLNYLEEFTRATVSGT